MEENITLDPEYADLIIEVNKLKDTVAEKIARKRYVSISYYSRY